MDTSTYKVLELPKYGGKLNASTRTLRNLLPGEILVKVHATTIHPADNFFLHGAYGAIKPDVFPLVPGFEGSGEIVKVGEGVDSNLIGKRAAVFSNSGHTGSFEGLWAQYYYTTPKFAMIFNKEVAYEKIAFALINPITALGFIDTIKKAGAKWVGQSGSSSAFGKMFIRLCAQEGIKTVNLVRKEQHIPTLTELGADVVISTSDPNWQQELQKIAKEHNISHFFDCVGGDTTAAILKALPDRSILYHFGNLELKNLGNIDSSNFIFGEKVIRGWWLATWLSTLKPEEFVHWWKYIIDSFESGSELFHTKVIQSYALDDYEKAREAYLKDMSGGKVLLQPNI